MDLVENGIGRKMDLPQKCIWQKNGFATKMDLA